MSHQTMARQMMARQTRIMAHHQLMMLTRQTCSASLSRRQLLRGRLLVLPAAAAQRQTRAARPCCTQQAVTAKVTSGRMRDLASTIAKQAQHSQVPALTFRRQQLGSLLGMRLLVRHAAPLAAMQIADGSRARLLNFPSRLQVHSAI